MSTDEERADVERLANQMADIAAERLEEFLDGLAEDFDEASIAGALFIRAVHCVLMAHGGARGADLMLRHLGGALQDHIATEIVVAADDARGLSTADLALGVIKPEGRA